MMKMTDLLRLHGLDTSKRKVQFVKAIQNLPRDISADIDRRNSLRNALAHSFEPETLRSEGAVKWKGKDIFSFEGLEGFVQDMRNVTGFFLGERPRRQSKGRR